MYIDVKIKIHLLNLLNFIHNWNYNFPIQMVQRNSKNSDMESILNLTIMRI